MLRRSVASAGPFLLQRHPVARIELRVIPLPDDRVDEVALGGLPLTLPLLSFLASL